MIVFLFNFFVGSKNFLQRSKAMDADRGDRPEVSFCFYVGKRTKRTVRLGGLTVPISLPVTTFSPL